MATPALLISPSQELAATFRLDHFLYPDRQPAWAGRVPGQGVLTVVGHPGSGAEEAVQRIAEAERNGRSGVWLDARLYGDRKTFLDALTDKLLERLLGPGTPARWRAGELPSQDALASLGTRRAAEIGHALSDLRARSQSVADLLALADGAPIGITWAHMLSDRAMGRLLWELRASVAGSNDGATLVLSTFPATRQLLLGPEAPLFGVGTQLELTDPTTSRWRELVQMHHLPVRDEDLLWLLLRTNGQSRATGAILSMTRHASRDSLWAAREIWEALANGARSRVAEQLSLVRAVTSHGPALLAAIATGRGPYSALRRYASPKQISRALDQLAFNGLIYQPRPRLWLLAQPVLRDAFAEWQISEWRI
jgi:hypothetical protein